MPVRNYSNTAVETTLNGAITNVATSLTVNSDVGFPAVPFTIQCESEVILVTARTGTNFSTVTRGYDGTSAVAHNDAVTVKHVVVAKDFTDVEARIVLQKSGVLVAEAGTRRLYFDEAFEVDTVYAHVQTTAPTGASVIVDVHKNGTTLFTTQGNRPEIAAAAWRDTTGNTPDVTSIAAGDYLTLDVDQIGSTDAGEDLVVTIKGRYT